MVDEIGGSGSLEKIPQSDSKMVAGAKRRGEELEGECDVSRKHAKMGDLQSKGIEAHERDTAKLDETDEPMDIVETQSSQVLDKNAIKNADAGHLRGLRKSSTSVAEHSVSMPLDLNAELCTDENSGYNDAIISLGDSKKHSSIAKGKAHLGCNLSLGSIRLDLNAEDVASSANHDPFYSNRSQSNPRMKETSDSGRTTGHVVEKDALKKWKEMKKNGFMSSSNGYGGIPPAAPKPRGRKSKSEVLKQKMEQAKKEQVDRFTKIAAPSGLLNGLNPGIINHVRNSKQVHSIIQALVRSEKRENRRQATEMRALNGEQGEKTTKQDNVNIFGAQDSGPSHVVSSLNSMPESSLLRENHFSLNTPLFNSEDSSGCRDKGSEEGTASAKTSLFSYSNNSGEDDLLSLKLASTPKVCESTSCLSNDELANVSSVDTLSVKAATVASHWLQLIHQDIKGRLAALRRSKKRVQAVITTELPILLSKEFPSNQENDPNVLKNSASGYSTKAPTGLHQLHWSKLFNQMDDSLSEEEKGLESWLNQVNEMMLLCGEGLQHLHWNSIFEMQHMRAEDNNLRSKMKNDPEKELSVRAAAASIYSTCNFTSSQENVSCC